MKCEQDPTALGTAPGIRDSSCPRWEGGREEGRNQKGNRLKKEENKVKVRNRKTQVKKTQNTPTPQNANIEKYREAEARAENQGENLEHDCKHINTELREPSDEFSRGVKHLLSPLPQAAQASRASGQFSVASASLARLWRRSRAQSMQFHICWCLPGRSHQPHCEANPYHKGAPSNLEFLPKKSRAISVCMGIIGGLGNPGAMNSNTHLTCKVFLAGQRTKLSPCKSPGL